MDSIRRISGPVNNSTSEVSIKELNPKNPILTGIAKAPDSFEVSKSTVAPFGTAKGEKYKEYAAVLEQCKNLRGQASTIKSTANALAAELATLAACLATMPEIGKILSAVYLNIAANIILQAEIEAKALEDEAAAKEKEMGLAKMKEEKEEDAKKAATEAENQKTIQLGQQQSSNLTRSLK